MNSFGGLPAHEVIMFAIGILLLVVDIWRWMSGRSKAAELIAILPVALGLLGYPASHIWHNHHASLESVYAARVASPSTPAEPAWLRDSAVWIAERQA